jgi:hypothetical protein
MNRKDLQNITEVWDSVTACENLCEEWLQERIDEGFDFSQNTIEELAEALKGSLMDKAKQDGASRAAAQGQAFQSFANRGGILGFLQRRLQSARQAVQQRGGPRGQGNRPIAGNPNRQGGQAVAPTPKPTTTPAAPVRPAAPVAKPSTSVAGTFKPVPGAPTQASLATARPAPEKANILGNKASELAALQAKAKADSLAQAAKNRARGQSPRGVREQTDLDLFDIVKGYLLDEGATEEEALKRMAVMTEEERNEIIESSCGGGHSKKKKKKSGY